MASLIYQLPADNLSPVATGGGSDWVVNTGTVNSAYPATNLGNLNPAKPGKLTTTTGSWVRDLGSAKNLDLVALPMYNLTAGLNVRIQGNASNSWGAPSLDQAITIPTYMEDGFPFPAWVDLTGIGSRSFQFWRFAVVGTNAAAVAVGEIWLGATKRSLPQNLQWGLHLVDSHRVLEQKTPFGASLIYDMGTKIRSVSGQIQGTDAGMASLFSWHRACGGRAKPTLIIVDPAINDAMMVRWTDQQLDRQHDFLDNSIARVGWDEMSRGLPL